MDEEVEFDNSKEGENIAVNALMDELKLLRQEMNTINDNNQLSENEEMNSLKNQIRPPRGGLIYVRLGNRRGGVLLKVFTHREFTFNTGLVSGYCFLKKVC